MLQNDWFATMIAEKDSKALTGAAESLSPRGRALRLVAASWAAQASSGT